MDTPPRDTPQAEPATVGYTIRWDIELGAGGMAQVYLGYAPAPRRDLPVAIKVQREELATDFQVSSRFMREAVISQELTHPNIVATRAMFEHEGRFALVLDLVGPPVRALRDTLRGDWDALRCVARDGASALAYLAQEGVVHRDISSGNLLVDPRGRIKLSDFGLASRYDGAYTPPTCGGTWAYLSPERLAGERGTAASDAFSFGALLYELATGIVPFGPNQKTVTVGLPLGAPPLPDEVPDDMRTVIGGFLALDPERRLLPDEVDSLLVPERQPARERIGTGTRIWLHARCPNVEHPSERVRLYGWEAAAPRVTDDEPAVTHAVSLVDDEPAVTHAVRLTDESPKRRWVSALAVTVLPAAAAAAGAWTVLELRESARGAAVDVASPSTPASIPADGVTVRLPDSVPVRFPDTSSLLSVADERVPATPTLVAPGWPPGVVNQVVERASAARPAIDEIAAALKDHKKLHTLPIGTLLLSPAVWRGDVVMLPYQIVTGQPIEHVIAVGRSNEPIEAAITHHTDDEGVFELGNVHESDERLQILLEDSAGHVAELEIEVPTRQ